MVVAYYNRRVRSSNVRGFVSTMPTLYEEEEEEEDYAPLYRNMRMRSSILCASGTLTRFYATVESSVMLCIMIQINVMQKLNCACAYCDTAERNLLLILLLLRTALAPY